MHYAVIPVSGDIEFKEADRIELDHLYEATKAETVQAVELSREGQEATLWLDEEGKVNARQVNHRADYIAHMFSGVAPDDVIVGDAVITGPADEDGETTGLTEAWRRFLTELPADVSQPA